MDSKSLKALQAKWNLILESEGLGEIEVFKHGESLLKRYSSQAFGDASAAEVEAQLSFSLELSRLVGMTKFKRPIDRFIMEQFSEGRTKEEIRRKLLGLGISRKRHTIAETIRKYLILYGLHGKHLYSHRIKRR